MRLCFVWRRPAVSTSSRSAFRASATAHASWTTAAGSAPALCFTRGTFRRAAQTSSCSTAAARNVSAAARTTDFPAAVARAASLAVVVVFPVPLTPTMRITWGEPAAAPANSGPLTDNLRVISAFRTRRTISCSAASRRPASAFTAATSSAAVAGPRRPPRGGPPPARRAPRIRLERGPFHRAPHLREELRVGHEEPALQAGEDGRTVALAFGHQLLRLAGHEAQEISAARRTRASSRRGRATCVWPAASKTTRTK